MGVSKEPLATAVVAPFLSPETVAFLSLLGFSVSVASISGLYLYNVLLFIYPSSITDIHLLLGFKTAESILQGQLITLQSELLNILNQNQALCSELIRQKQFGIEVVTQIDGKFSAISRLLDLFKSQNIQEISGLVSKIEELRTSFELLKAEVGVDQIARFEGGRIGPANCGCRRSSR